MQMARRGHIAPLPRPLAANRESSVETGPQRGTVPDHDVAVVGGGVSGVYSAWPRREVGHRSPVLAPLARARLDGRLRIGLFEYSRRIGGRLFSLPLPGH